MDVQKTMDFILEQQAAASASIARIDIVIERLVESHYNMEQNFAKLAEALTETNGSLAETNRTLADTNKTLAETNKTLADTNRSVSAIALASAQTDARLDRLSERVDRISAKVDALVEIVGLTVRRPEPPSA